MKGLHLIGILLLLAGIALAATSHLSFEESKGFLSTQTMNASIKSHPTQVWPWLAGILAVGAGVVMFILMSKKKR